MNVEKRKIKKKKGIARKTKLEVVGGSRAKGIRPRKKRQMGILASKKSDALFLSKRKW